jgi:hypothetical protein
VLDPTEKNFQLEELEDRERSTTEVFFARDNTVVLGESDGPTFTSATGTWNLDQQQGKFSMVLERTYEAGRTPVTFTDLGVFDFKVTRTFVGKMVEIGARVAVSGTIHDVDGEHGDKEVGFFNLIDTKKGEIEE